MDSILISRTPDSFNARRHLKCTDHTPIPLRYHKVLSLHMAGLKVKEICRETGYKEASVYAILKDPRVVQVRQGLLVEAQDRFESLYPKVVDVIAENLNSPDSETAARAVDQWMRGAGKYKDGGQSGQVNVTAEDVVIQILNQNSEGK